jgi:hypothetical protein
MNKEPKSAPGDEDDEELDEISDVIFHEQTDSSTVFQIHPPPAP